MYPISYEADFNPDRNRLTTFFRVIMAIPLVIVLYIYAIGAAVALIVGWIAGLITGHLPGWSHRLLGGFLRYATRMNAYIGLQTDDYPPFRLAHDPTYPVRLNVPAEPEDQSRVKIFFRGILIIPMLIMSYPLNMLHGGAIIASWLTIVFRGYQPAGIHNAIAYTTAFQARLTSYMFLLTDSYPPIGAEAGKGGEPMAAIPAGPAPAASLPSSAPTVEQPRPEV